MSSASNLHSFGVGMMDFIDWTGENIALNVVQMQQGLLFYYLIEWPAARMVWLEALYISDQ